MLGFDIGITSSQLPYGVFIQPPKQDYGRVEDDKRPEGRLNHHLIHSWKGDSQDEQRDYVHRANRVDGGLCI